MDLWGLWKEEAAGPSGYDWLSYVHCCLTHDTICFSASKSRLSMGREAGSRCNDTNLRSQNIGTGICRRNGFLFQIPSDESSTDNLLRPLSGCSHYTCPPDRACRGNRTVARQRLPRTSKNGPQRRDAVAKRNDTWTIAEQVAQTHQESRIAVCHVQARSRCRPR